MFVMVLSAPINHEHWDDAVIGQIYTTPLSLPITLSGPGVSREGALQRIICTDVWNRGWSSGHSDYCIYWDARRAALLNCAVTQDGRHTAARWSLYVPHSCHYMYRKFNIQLFYVLPTHCIYVFCVDLRTNSHYSLYNINWLVCITEI